MYEFQLVVGWEAVLFYFSWIILGTVFTIGLFIAIFIDEFIINTKKYTARHSLFVDQIIFYLKAYQKYIFSKLKTFFMTKKQIKKKEKVKQRALNEQNKVDDLFSPDESQEDSGKEE